MREAIRLCYSDVIRELAAIVNAPQTDDMLAKELLPRDPVMENVMRIREAMDRLNAASRLADGRGEGVDGLQRIYLKDMENTLKQLHTLVGLDDPDSDALIERVRILAPPEPPTAAVPPLRRCPYCAGVIYTDAGCQNCKVGSTHPRPATTDAGREDALRRLNGDLCAFAMRWEIDGDYMRCRECRRNQCASYAANEFPHAPDCRHAVNPGTTEPRPWEAFAALIQPVTPAGGEDGETSTGPLQDSSAPQRFESDTTAGPNSQMAAKSGTCNGPSFDAWFGPDSQGCYYVRQREGWFYAKPKTMLSPSEFDAALAITAERGSGSS